MALWDKLKQASNYLRNLRLSLGPDSYFQYKRDRKHERKQADHAREHEKDSAAREREQAEHGREKAERERDYEQRYTREREGDITQELTGRTEETKPDC
jgi:hypothetical protein